MRLNLENKIKLVVIGFSLTVAAIIGGAILPTARDIYDINRETLDLRNYLEQKHKNALGLRQSAEKINAAKQQTGIFSAALYRAGDELKLITFLENTAAKNNLAQKIQAPNLDKPENKIIKFSLNLNGQYRNILEYLSDLEAAPYFIIINRLQLSDASRNTSRSSAPNNNFDSINVDLDLQMYVSS